jgi:hypothetical protein
MLGHVQLTNNKSKKKSMYDTDSVGMHIQTYRNPSVPDSDVTGQTAKGPHYKLGTGAVKGLLGHIRKIYPNIKYINRSERVTGTRGEEGKPRKGARLRF